MPRHNLEEAFIPGQRVFISRKQSLLRIAGVAGWAYVFVVAKSGGDYTTIQGAIDAVSGMASSANRYLVLVMPGDYDETVTMAAWVDVVGMSRHAVRITGASGTLVTGADNCLLSTLTIAPTAATNAVTALSNADGNNDFGVLDVDIFGDVVFSSGKMERCWTESAQTNTDLLTVSNTSEANAAEFHDCTFKGLATNTDGLDVVDLGNSAWARFYHCTIQSFTGLKTSTVVEADGISNKRQLYMSHCHLMVEMNHTDGAENDYCTVFTGGGEFHNCSFHGYGLNQAETPKSLGAIPAAGATFDSCSFRGQAQANTICSGPIEMFGCSVEGSIKVDLRDSAIFTNCDDVRIEVLNSAGTDTLQIRNSRVYGAWTYTAGTWTVTLNNNSYPLGVGILTQNANITYGNLSDPTLVTTQTGNFTARAADDLILVDASGGNVTITLPAVANIAGTEINIKKIDSSGNTVTVDGNGSETIDGALTQVITAQYVNITVKTDGSAWYII